MKFNGPDYNHERDSARLSIQFLRIFGLMSDGVSRTLQEIADITGDPATSVSAQLRHMRKARFGGHLVTKIYLGDGLYGYTLTVSEKEPETV